MGDEAQGEEEEDEEEGERHEKAKQGGRRDIVLSDLQSYNTKRMNRYELVQCEVSLVKSVQDKMADLLTKTPFLSAEEEQSMLQKYVDLLRTRTEEMIIFIQVMLKVKQELAYARLDLERCIALKSGSEECKKRVNWLSERLKKLSKMCHNYFFEIQRVLSKASMCSKEGREESALDVSRMVSESCTCGMLRRSIEEQTLREVQGTVKTVLKASSDVLVSRPGGSNFKKIYKSCESPIYNGGLLDPERYDSMGESDQESDVDEVSVGFNALPLSNADSTNQTVDVDLRDMVDPGKREKSKKLDSLVSYQSRALDQLVKNLNHLYDHMDDADDGEGGDEEDEVENVDKERSNTTAAEEVPTVSVADLSNAVPEKQSDDELKVVDQDHLKPSKTDEVSSRGGGRSDSERFSMLIPVISNDENGDQVKKEVLPRSPVVWCPHAASGSAMFLNHSMLNQNVNAKGGKAKPTSSQLSGTVKGVKGMKKAAHQIKAITKLRKVTAASNAECSKRQRIMELLGSSGLRSTNKNIAVDAAKALGQLQYLDDIVLSGLQKVIEERKTRLLVYECAKSMILLGCWRDCAMDVLTYHLNRENKKVIEDVLLTLKQSQDGHFIPKSSDSLFALSKALMNLQNDSNENIAFNAALSLGHLCINTDRTKWLLLDSLVNSSYTTKFEALNVLVKQMNCQDSDVIDALLYQLRNANCWKHRMQAIDLLKDIGLKRLKVYGMKKVFEVLQELLWNHSNKELRSKVVALLDDFGLRKEACANVLKRLSDKNESVRANSVVALVTLGMKGERELKILLDMFDLDSSPHVRGEVIKAFVEMKWNHPHVVRVLEDRQKADDVLAKKATTAFNYLKNIDA